MMKRYVLLLALLCTAVPAVHAQTAPQLIINEFLADPPVDTPGDANRDGTRHAQHDEFVELVNLSSRDTLDLSGWQLGDDERVNFTFPDGYKLAPRGLVVVFGGGDVSNAPGYDADPLVSRVLVSPDSIGNGLANGGETIVLLSPDGSADTYLSYGSRAGQGAPEIEGVTFEFGGDVGVNAAADVAVVRAPDGNPAADAWALHTDWSADLFSPAFTIDGADRVPKIPPPLTVIVNEVLIDPAGASAVDLAGDANDDGVRDAQADEFIELANISDEPVDLSGYTLGDDENYVSFTFPDGYVLQPRSFVTVFGGGNVQNVPGYDVDPLQTRAFVIDSLQHGGIGNGFANGGDFVYFLSPDGSYDTYFAYGSKNGIGGPPAEATPAGVEFEFTIETATPGNGNQSVTRFPDANTSAADPFVLHENVSAASFSPNATIDGRSTVPGPTPPITVVINEVLPAATADANGDGAVDAGADSFIELVNTSETDAVDLSGFAVGDASGTTFTFPDGYRLAPRSFVAVFGGGDVSGVPGYDADPLASRVFAASGSLGDGLDAAGDAAVLVSPDGAYDAFVAYGSAAGAGEPTVPTADGAWEFALSTETALAAGASITRTPDGDFLSPDPFALHTDVSTLPYSPAQTTVGLGGLDDFVDVPHPWGSGSALHFRRFEGDRVEIRSASQELPLRLEEGTIEFWMRPDSVITNDTHGPDWTYIIGKNRGGGVDPGDLGIAWARGEGNLTVYMNDEQGNQDEVSSSDNDKEIFYPRWYHVAVTWGADSLRLFIDGELRDSAPSTMPLLSGDQLLLFGNGSYNLLNSSVEGFPGILDEIRLSATERYTSDFDTPTAPFSPDAFTVGLWHFDEGQGDVAENAVAAGYLTGSLGGVDADDNFDPVTQPDWVDIATLVDTEDETALPGQFVLEGNYPNPFNPSTTFRYALPVAADVEVGVYNVLGQRVQLLVQEQQPAGTYTVEVDGSRLASGVYFYTLRSGDVHLVQKMVLLK